MAGKAKSGSARKAEESKGPLHAVATSIQYVTGPWNRKNALDWAKMLAFVFTVWWLLVQPFRIPSQSMYPTLNGDPGFFVGDRVFVNKTAFGLHIPFTNIHLFDWAEPKRWDIVVFRTIDQSEDEPPKTIFGKAFNALFPKVLVKRVVGLPGERVHIADGKIYINGVAQTLPPGMPPVRYTEGPVYTKEELDNFLKGVPPSQVPAVIDSLKAQAAEYKYAVDPTDQYSLVPPDRYLMLGDNSAQSRDGRRFGWVPRDHLLGRAFCIWWPFANRRDLTGFTHTWWGLGLLIGIPFVLALFEARGYWNKGARVIAPQESKSKKNNADAGVVRSRLNAESDR